MNRFADRIALVTGAGGGIGGAVARLLVQEGATVVVADLDHEAAVRTATGLGVQTRAVALDVTDPRSCQGAIDAATAIGDGRLDVLVNVAGIGQFCATEDVTLEAWNRTLQVNLTGTFLMSQLALPGLLAAGGAIVNVASIAGVRATPYNAAYCASKGGVILLTKAMAVEFGRRGLRVNCVCPSSVDTDFLKGFAWPAGIDMSLFARASSVLEGRMDPSEVAAAIAYLASDDARMVTGSALIMDGGATA